jgi:hypothetical protein
MKRRENIAKIAKRMNWARENMARAEASCLQHYTNKNKRVLRIATFYFKDLQEEIQFYRHQLQHDFHKTAFDGGRYNETLINEKEQQNEWNNKFERQQKRLTQLTATASTLGDDLIAAAQNVSNNPNNKKYRTQLQNMNTRLTKLGTDIDVLQQAMLKYEEIRTETEKMNEAIQQLSTAKNTLDNHLSEENFRIFETAEREYRKVERSLTRKRGAINKIERAAKEAIEKKRKEDEKISRQEERRGQRMMEDPENYQASDGSEDSDDSDDICPIVEEASDVEDSQNNSSQGQSSSGYDDGAKCDVCGAIVHEYWHCIKCKDYDLCQKCYDTDHVGLQCTVSTDGHDDHVYEKRTKSPPNSQEVPQLDGSDDDLSSELGSDDLADDVENPLGWHKPEKGNKPTKGNDALNASKKKK